MLLLRSHAVVSLFALALCGLLFLACGPDDGDIATTYQGRRFVPPGGTAPPAAEGEDPPALPEEPGPGPVSPTPEEPDPEPEPEPGPDAGPIDACFATATGILGEDDGPVNYGGEPVETVATHRADSRCLTAIDFTFTRQGACPMKLSYGVVGGLWALKGATIKADPECGEGWGSGKVYSAVMAQSEGSLFGLPDIVALPQGSQSCSILPERVDLMGTLVVKNGQTLVTLSLTGLGVEGALLSSAVDSGSCGASPVVCQGLECGADPLFGTSCGFCSDGNYCSAGACVEGTQAQAACARFNSDRALLKEGAWAGSVSSCQPGTMSADWQERSLISVNLYRWFAGLPPLTLNPSLYSGQQECALILDANNSLSHNPGPGWACYTSKGASHAGSSNIATTPSIKAIDLYMVDPGNASTLGHRRWILSNWLSYTAFGSTSSYSCMATKSANGIGKNQWTAWPPPGHYPLDWHKLSWGPTTDSTGWSIQSDSITLSGAQVIVRENGQTKPVSVQGLSGGYGSQSAIKIVPSGWKLKANATYQVNVTSISTPINYEFVAVNCAAMQ